MPPKTNLNHFACATALFAALGGCAADFQEEAVELGEGEQASTSAVTVLPPMDDVSQDQTLVRLELGNGRAVEFQRVRPGVMFVREVRPDGADFPSVLQDVDPTRDTFSTLYLRLAAENVDYRALQRLVDQEAELDLGAVDEELAIDAIDELAIDAMEDGLGGEPLLGEALQDGRTAQKTLQRTNQYSNPYDFYYGLCEPYRWSNCHHYLTAEYNRASKARNLIAHVRNYGNPGGQFPWVRISADAGDRSGTLVAREPAISGYHFSFWLQTRKTMKLGIHTEKAFSTGTLTYGLAVLATRDLIVGGRPTVSIP